MSKKYVVIIIFIAMILFIIGQFVGLSEDIDFEDLVTAIIAMVFSYYIFTAPVLAFACVSLWQPRINSGVIDDKKKLDDYLYRFIIAMQLLLFILFAAVNSNFACGIGNYMVFYILLLILYNIIVLGTCLISLLKKSGLVILSKVIIAAISLFAVTYSLILLVRCIS